MECPHCHKDSPPDARFCPYCGTAFPRLCHNCGAEHPPEARFCMRCGQPLAKETPAPTSTPAGAPTEEDAITLVGERRVITALFADVKGSTDLAEQVDVETWVEIMNHVFHLLEAEVYRYGGEVDQFRGDEVVAFFGVPTTHEDDAERAVLAAMAMQEAAQRYAAELAEQEGAPAELLLRVGVNTGEVIHASVGDRSQYSEDTAMGRAIALAARLQVAAEPGTVLVSEDTYRLVRPLFEWEALGQVAVKGIREPVTVYRPLARAAHDRAVGGKGRGIEGLESPLVGRDGQLRALQEVVEHLRQENVGGIVTLVGEAGIGKSRLVAEVRKTADRRPQTADGGMAWVEGRCLSYATGIAYSLWLDLLRGLLDVAPDAPPVVVRDALQAWLTALCLDCLDDVYPFLGRLLSLPLDEQAESRLRGIDAEGLKVLTFRAVETLVERAARRQPLVVVCEDLHWADPTSLALLEHLLPLADRVPLLLLCILRPETTHGCWQVRETVARLFPHQHVDLWLDPLSVAESQELVRNLLRVEDLPHVLRERILERTEGNPFFLEEILRSLIDGGIVVHDELTGRWHATEDVADLAIPDTLQGVLRARIDRLPAEARRVLQIASVIGRIFSRPVLAAVAREQDLDDHLLTCQREQMIRERARRPEREFAFKHYLTAEAAYGGLLRRERRAYHHRVAETLERLYPERVEGQLGLLAFHWEQAGQAARAADYLERAGAQAASQFANEEALSYLTRALSLTPDGDLLGRYRRLLTREAVHHLQGARADQRSDLLALRDLARVLDDGGREAARRRAEVALRETKYHQRTGDRASATASVEEAIRLAQVAQDTAIEAAGHLLRAGTVAELEHALALARAAQGRALEAEILRELGLVSQRRGEYARAIAYQEQTLRIYREIGNRMGEGRALNGLGMAFLRKGNYASAKRYSEQGLTLCRETGNRYDEAWALGQVGEVFMDEGDYAPAITHWEQAMRIISETGDRFMEQLGLVMMGKVYRRLGNYERSLELYEQALHSPYAYRSAHAWVLAEKGLLLHDTGDDALARECCERALSVAYARDRPPERTERLIYLGHALTGLGRLAEAQDAYREALSLLRDMGLHHLSTAPLSGLAHAALADGQPAQALAYAEEVLHYLNVHPALDSTGGLFREYLTCYRVLRANEDPRATELLSQAYGLLQERARTIQDQALRRSYLENIAAHREIASEFVRLSEGPTNA